VAHPSRTLRRKPGDVPAFGQNVCLVSVDSRTPCISGFSGLSTRGVAEAVIILAAMMQPPLILDKSVLQMLNRQDLFELNVFFEMVGTPVLTNKMVVAFGTNAVP
jgi:hypothetical protein